MQNVHTVSKSGFNVLFNGALVLGVSTYNIMYRKMDKTIHGNCASIQPTFSEYRSQFTGKPCTHLHR
jgi:hypothetical protein